jgi:type II secretory pathway pseudopilin PulG
MAVSHNASSPFKIKKCSPSLGKGRSQMKNLLRLLLKTQHRQNRSLQGQKEQGMTLIELLIGMVMAFLIITPMLAFVVDMLNTDRREQVKANTEQDIQAAVDFIAQDLSQAIYIYDNAGITTINASPTPLPNVPNATPILVFWKRQQLKNSLPITASAKPKDCLEGTLTGTGACNDTYVLSLVAYYQVKDTNPIWCQPSGNPCPIRIARYRIQDGLRDPSSTNPDPSQRYFSDADLGDKKDSLKRSDAFNIGDASNAGFDISKPLENVTIANVAWDSEVLVNYIHHNTVNLPTPDAEECEKALGKPTTQVGATTTKIPEETLKIGSIPATPANFYACVDTARNLARVTIRGNSLRRIQNNADYNPNNSAYFPTATVQVQGLGARGN